MLQDNFIMSAKQIIGDSMKDLEVIERQLDRVLGFFPRVESRISGIFTFNSIILAISALNITAQDVKLWYVCVPAIAILAALLCSYFHLFHANFPDIKGGEGSLIFFAEIKKKTEANYRDDLVGCTEEKLRNDLIGQIWRNSQILCAKYEGVRSAIFWSGLAMIPFVLFLIATAVVHGRIPLLTFS